MLGGVGEVPDDSAVERPLHYVYEHVDQFYSFKGLHKFKAKSHPLWSPCYLVFPGYANLPAMGFTLEYASSDSDFLRVYLADALRQFRSRWANRLHRQAAQ